MTITDLQLMPYFVIHHRALQKPVQLNNRRHTKLEDLPRPIYQYRHVLPASITETYNMIQDHTVQLTRYYKLTTLLSI